MKCVSKPMFLTSLFPYQKCLMVALSDKEIQLQLRDITNYVIIPVQILVIFASLVCNAFVVITVAHTQSLRQHPPQLMLSSLAITDVIFALNALYRIILVLAHEHKCPNNTTNPLFARLYIQATLGNMAIISIDRYLAVRKLWWYRAHMNKSRALKMIGLPWVATVVVTSLLYLESLSDGPFPFGKIIAFLFYFLCTFCTIFSYIFLFCNKTPPEEVMNIRNVYEREKRLANTVAWILLLLVALFLPGTIVPLVLIAANVPNVPAYARYSVFLLLLNGLLNPLVNFGRNKRMRKALTKLLTCSQQVEPVM